MKDAVGSSILLTIILAFLAIFIIFTAFIMNYAACYRASNYVLTMIERTEGNIPVGTSSDNANSNTIIGQLKARNYYNSLEIDCFENKNGAIYKVKTSVPFNLPLIGVTLNLYVKNETKTIYNTQCNSNLNANFDKLY